MKIRWAIGVLVCGVMMLGLILLASPSPQPGPVAVAPVSPAPRPGRGGVLGTATQLRIQGKFAEAEALLRHEYSVSREAAHERMLLSLLEDSGKPDELVTEARAYVQRSPGDPYGRWVLARGLLFAAATHPVERAASGWIDEAAGLTQGLAAVHYTPKDSPGGLSILRAQTAFLRRQWAAADKLAQQSLKEGTTEGESAELVAMRCDLAIRAGRMGDAEALLDRVLAIMESWKKPVYYMLRTHQEDALIVREVYFGRPYTKQDIDALDVYHRRLRETGVVDPLTPTDEYKRMHESMRAWIDLRERGDASGQLDLVEAAIANQAADPSAARCFYSEAIVRPFKRAYFHLAAGDLCKALGRKDEALAHYEEALKSHPDDRLIQLRLKQLD